MGRVWFDWGAGIEVGGGAARGGRNLGKAWRRAELTVIGKFGQENFYSM